MEGGGTNYRRHSKVSTLLNSLDVTPKERVRLSSSMTHYVDIQVDYNSLFLVPLNFL